MIKGIIFGYVVIAMLYYLVTVWLFTSEIALESEISQIPIIDGMTSKDLRIHGYKMCKNNDVLYFLFVSICGMIGGFCLPITLLIRIIKS